MARHKISPSGMNCDWLMGDMLIGDTSPAGGGGWKKEEGGGRRTTVRSWMNSRRSMWGYDVMVKQQHFASLGSSPSPCAFLASHCSCFCCRILSFTKRPLESLALLSKSPQKCINRQQISRVEFQFVNEGKKITATGLYTCKLTFLTALKSSECNLLTTRQTSFSPDYDRKHLPYWGIELKCSQSSTAAAASVL